MSEIGFDVGQGRRPRDKTISNFIQQLGPDTLCVTFSGVMEQADRSAAESAARALIAKAGKIKVMFILQDFKGIAKEGDWGNLDFYAQHGDDIVKMAIVGDSKWKDMAFVFTGKGARVTQIDYFETAALAKAQAWLSNR